MDQPPAIVHVQADLGGRLSDYIALATVLEKLRYRVQIDGDCMSACTLLLQVSDHCVGPAARLGFHSPALGVSRSDPDGSIQRGMDKLMLDSYPQSVRDWIASHGGLRPRVIYLTGRELKARVTPCGAAR